MTLTRIGYWSGSPDDGWPHVDRFVDHSWDEDERDDVISHLKQGLVIRSYLGVSSCRVCGRLNGSSELTDGVYTWPEGLAHYVEAHGVRLPQRFVDSLVSTRSFWEDIPVDDGWWRATESP